MLQSQMSCQGDQIKNPASVVHFISDIAVRIDHFPSDTSCNATNK